MYHLCPVIRAPDISGVGVGGWWWTPICTVYSLYLVTKLSPNYKIECIVTGKTQVFKICTWLDDGKSVLPPHSNKFSVNLRDIKMQNIAELRSDCLNIQIGPNTQSDWVNWSSESTLNTQTILMIFKYELRHFWHVVQRERPRSNVLYNIE